MQIENYNAPIAVCDELKLVVLSPACHNIATTIFPEYATLWKLGEKKDAPLYRLGGAAYARIGFIAEPAAQMVQAYIASDSWIKDTYALVDFIRTVLADPVLTADRQRVLRLNPAVLGSLASQTGSFDPDDNSHYEIDCIVRAECLEEMAPRLRRRFCTSPGHVGTFYYDTDYETVHATAESLPRDVKMLIGKRYSADYAMLADIRKMADEGKGSKAFLVL